MDGDLQIGSVRHERIILNKEALLQMVSEIVYPSQ
jgi:hypothetical protein